MEGLPIAATTVEKKLVQARLNFQIFNKPPKLALTESTRKQLCFSSSNSVKEDKKDCNESPIVVLDDDELSCSPKVLSPKLPLSDSPDIIGDGFDKENKEQWPHESARKKLCLSVNDGDSRISCTVNDNESGVDPAQSSELAIEEDIRTETCPKLACKAEKPVKKRKLVDVDASPDSTATGTKLLKTDCVELKSVEVISIDTETDSEKCKIGLDHSIAPSELSVTLDEGSHAESSDKTPPPAKQSGAARKKTPKQLEKEAEMTRKKEEKVRLREEKEKERLQKKEEKQLQKKVEEEQRRKQREEKELRKKKELEEKEELKKKAKEEKDRKKQQDVNMKNEEKRRREEEKKKKEEELQRRKEEETMLKNKFAKEAVAFTNFFTKAGNLRKSEAPPEEAVFFKPFAVKNGMRLAPLNRNPLDEPRKAALDDSMAAQSECETYITQLRCGELKPGHSSNTWPLDEKYLDAEVSIVEDFGVQGATAVAAPKKRLPRPKLLQFSENRRPPYWGTWCKKCPQVGPRKPFGQYKIFDYEVDSDEEWEEEEPGESLHGSDDEKEEEDDYEVDNDFFVPHGYLSEDEEEDEESAFNPEHMKAKLKLLGEQFDKERNEKTRQLRALLLGCIWFPEDVSGVNSKVKALLTARDSTAWLGPLPIETANFATEDLESELPDGDSPPRTVTKKATFPAEGVPILLKITHGALVKRQTLATEFLTYWTRENPNLPVPSLAAVKRKVKELAQWQECPEEPLLGRLCWFVPREVREQNGCGDVTLPNSWPFPAGRTSDAQDDLQRITKFTKVLSEEERRQLLVAEPEVIFTEEKKPSPALITKFTKVLTEEERRMQLKPSALPSTPSTPKPPVFSPNIIKDLQKLSQFRAPPMEKKRVPLMMSMPLAGQKSTSTGHLLANPTSAAESTEPIKKKVPILLSAPCGVEIVKPTPENIDLVTTEVPPST